jgi:amidophosphoribosyltransferase
METEWPDNDKFHEECGVVAIYGHPEAANLAYLGLYALQHRTGARKAPESHPPTTVRCTGKSAWD